MRTGSRQHRIAKGISDSGAPTNRVRHWRYTNFPDATAEAVQVAKQTYLKNKENEFLLKQWQSHEGDLTNPNPPDSELIDSIKAYCTAWKDKNYGQLAEFFPNYTHMGKDAMAGEARSYYSQHPIDEYQLIAVSRPAAATAAASIQLGTPPRSWHTSIRMARLNDSNSPACEWEPGSWKVVQYATAPFVDCPDISQ